MKTIAGNCCFLLLLVMPLPAAEPDFARDVLPILQRSCFECHGRTKAEGGLRLDSAAALTAGGDSGPVVVGGKPASSELVRRISLPKNDTEVMPNRGAVLSRDEVARIRAWIAAGALWPAGVQPVPHWAYVPPRRVQPSALAVHPIDAFVRERLKGNRLQPAPVAEPAVLARRLYFDVIGLPPTPQQVAEFEGAAARNLPRAVAQLVDQLLASPQYGEKWARPWLDAALRWVVVSV